ncbi:MAG: antitoxin family protein [Planctomycetota bacterium]
MAKTIEAVFEDGVFKPISPITLSEHKRVTLVIKNNKEKTPYILSVASMVYEGLSSNDIKDIEELAFDRSGFSRNGN